MDENFVLTVRSMFERIMKETKTILVNMERRYVLFLQQQGLFVNALQRIRERERISKIKSIAQISDYVHHHSEHYGDTRICKIFLGLVTDLNEFRRTLERLSTPTNDVSLEFMFSTWKKVLDPTQDISHLRERKPYAQINQLGIEESRLFFGGIVSVLSIAMDCAKTAYKRLNAVKAYRIKANEYHYVEGIKIEKTKEKEERYFAEKYSKLCPKEACNSPLPGRTESAAAKQKLPARVGSSASQGKLKAQSLIPKKANSQAGGQASKGDYLSATKLETFSRPPTSKSDQRSVISSATASTRSTESDVMSHIKTHLLDPREIMSHGFDGRVRDDNVGRAFQWYDRKHTSSDSIASDQKRLQENYLKSKRDAKN